MSYEGFEQHICANGHHFNTGPTYSFDDDDKPICLICNAKSIFCNCVDDTNCENLGVILEKDWKKLLLTPEESKICNLGHLHVVKEATYRVPSKEELEKLRSYHDIHDNKYHPLSEYEANWAKYPGDTTGTDY